MSVDSGRRDVAVPLAAKVEFLKRPDSYPIPPARVDAVETHMAWVFLTDRFAYKLKKPVRYDYLDFSTLETRRRDCEEEFRLNRRLAFSVYFGTVPLVVDRDGNLRLGRLGEPIEWLVKMRRLPSERMLDVLIARQQVCEADTRRIGRLLGRCYRQSLPIEMAPALYRQRLARDIAENRRELLRPEFHLPAELVEQPTAAQCEFLNRRPELLDERVAAGRIIEAHGDLRPEHICLESPPVIIDCLEFNREFRILDSASELAFLALECERLGSPETGEAIVAACQRELDDLPPERLMRFYRSFHAVTRAKVAVWHLVDHDVRDHSKWTEKAVQYLRPAASDP